MTKVATFLSYEKQQNSLFIVIINYFVVVVDDVGLLFLFVSLLLFLQVQSCWVQFGGPASL